MIGEPLVPVECDVCFEEEWFDMTPLAQGGFDLRNIKTDLKNSGWEVLGDDERCICPDCVQEQEGE